MRKISVSIGIFAHNEENNIARILDSVLIQKTDIVSIKEILVISSGSNDKTNQIVRSYQQRNKKIFLIDQLKREGKSSAINLFLRLAKGKILVTISGDLRLAKDCIEEIVLPFLHPEIGMVGGHPKPSNVAHSQVGKEGKLLWQLHHLVSLKNPKCGEIVAFRNSINSIPKESAVDEATIEVLLKLIGYQVAYAPRAIVYNKLPKTISDFIVQRRRVYAGHLWLRHKYHYQVSTLSFSNDYEAIAQYLFAHPKQILYLIKLVGFEFYARLLGWVDYHILDKNPYVWQMVDR